MIGENALLSFSGGTCREILSDLPVDFWGKHRKSRDAGTLDGADSPDIHLSANAIVADTGL